MGRKLSELSEVAKKQQEILTGNINPNFYKLIREENNFSVEDFAELIGVSEAEYLMKEKGVIPFTFREITILLKKADKTYRKFDNPIKFSKNTEKIQKQIDRLSEEEREILRIQLLEGRSEHKKKLDDIYRNLRNLMKRKDDSHVKGEEE